MVTGAKHILFVAGLLLLVSSCDDTKQGGRGPIVLGDSSTIINETDPQQLKDLVTDLQPVIPPAENKDEENKEPVSQKPLPADTARPIAAAQPAKSQPDARQPLPNTPGLKVDFNEVTVLIPGLSVKQGKSRNLQNAHGATFSLTGGNINGATLRVTGNVLKVSQRYQTISVMKSDVGDLVLNDLSVTTRWETLKGGNGAYTISGLDTKSLQVYDADAEEIRDAVKRAAQRRRLSRRKVQDLVNDVRRVRAANQKPLTVTLRSVMWKIDGKDEQGRIFSKQIRVDVPL